MPNLTWNMNLNSSAALCILSTWKTLEMLTIIRILIKYSLRNLFHSAPVFKKCLFFLQQFSHKYRRSESVDLHYLNSGRGLTNLQCNTPECFAVSFPGGTILFPNAPGVLWECQFYFWGIMVSVIWWGSSLKYLTISINFNSLNVTLYQQCPCLFCSWIYFVFLENIPSSLCCIWLT